MCAKGGVAVRPQNPQPFESADWNRYTHKQAAESVSQQDRGASKPIRVDEGGEWKRKHLCYDSESVGVFVQNMLFPNIVLFFIKYICIYLYVYIYIY